MPPAPEGLPSAPALTRQRVRAVLASCAVLVAVALLVRFLWPAVMVLVVGGGLHYLFAPVVAALARKRVPRLVSAVVLVGALLVAVGIAGGQLLPRLYDELRQFGSQLPGHVDALERALQHSGWGVLLDEESLRAQLAQGQEWLLQRAGWLFSRTVQLVSTVITAVLGVIMGVYLLTGAEGLGRAAAGWIPPGARARWVRFGRGASRLVAGYVRARIIASLFIGFSYWLAFHLMGLKLSVLLAVLGGVLNLLPLIGPLVASVPVLLVAVTQGWPMVLGAIVVQVVAQQVESGILSPVLSGRYVRLPPAVVLFAVVAGGALLGAPGLLVAVPIVGVSKLALRVFYRETWETPELAP